MATYIMEAVNGDGVCCPDCSRANPCDPCVCPATTLLCATASASKTKYGFSEWFGNESIPPRIYSHVTLSGTAHERQWIGTCGTPVTPSVEQIYTFSGEATVSRDAFATTLSSTLSEHRVIKFDGVTTIDDTTPYGSAYASFVGSKGYATQGTTSACGTYSYTPTVATRVGFSLSCVSGVGSSCTTNVVTTISDEYDTATLIDNAIAAAGTPGAPTTCGTAIIASFSLSSDARTVSVKAGDYAFPIPVDATPCYKINWDRVETPSVGSPTVTPMEYIWDGSATQSPTYSEAVPGDNTAEPGYSNAITIENIVVTCTGCA
jgi:hypothetical protein